MFSRRRFLASVAPIVAAARTERAAAEQQPAPKTPVSRPATAAPGQLPLSRFQPRSMLHVVETKVERARFPVIDFHTHLSWQKVNQGPIPSGEVMTFLAPPADLLAVMDRKNLKMMVNLTGGVGRGLDQAVRDYDAAHPGRFLTFTEPWWVRTADSNYPAFQADEIQRAHRAGARGLKVLKTLGLYLRTRISTGTLIKIDDPRFDPMWETCGGLGIPVAIHISDPEAFFLPIDRFNERYEELHNHPDWSFHGKDFPSNRALIDARNRVFAKHPKTTFVTLHVGNDAENLADVGECLDRFPNMHVELGARIGELGRQPRTSGRFFDKYQDRILFGTDAIPHGDDVPQQVFGDALYEIYYRFLETADEYFDYAPAPVPPQGRWRIYGLGLPEAILQKVYWGNAARMLNIS